MTEIEEAATRAYDALSDIVDIADETRNELLLNAAERARDIVNGLAVMER